MKLAMEEKFKKETLVFKKKTLEVCIYCFKNESRIWTL
jgi:hypothetical protein